MDDELAPDRRDLDPAGEPAGEFFLGKAGTDVLPGFKEIDQERQDEDLFVCPRE